jgi:hypothetical protein
MRFAVSINRQLVILRIAAIDRFCRGGQLVAEVRNEVCCGGRDADCTWSQDS